MFIEFDNNTKFPKKNADIAESHEVFKDCGYLIEEEDLIVDVDVLPKDTLEKLIQYFNIKTQIVWTTRGAHFYFKKPQGFKRNKAICPLGFEVEFKHIGNTRAITVKQNGELRIFENEGEKEDLPEFFFTNKKLENLLGLDEGEGRNNSLFKHRMKISDLKQWQPILRFVNNHILAVPLPEEEFQTISRDVKIEAKTNDEPEVADYIRSKYKVHKYLGKLYFYDNNEYITDDDLLYRVIFNEVGLKKTRYVDEVKKQLDKRAPIINGSNVFDIKLQNGILREGEFFPVDYQEFTPYSINIPFDPKAQPIEEVDNYLDHLTNHDEDYRKRLLEILAHTLIVDKNFKRMLASFFIFIGDGGNGKGTLLQIIRTILGAKNCSALSIKQMTDEKYFVNMQNKLCNLGDDVQDEAINGDQMKALKNISTCDYVSTRRLFEQSIDVELTLSLIFTSNHILRSFEKGESYKRRVQWLPMFGKPAKKDKRFIQKLTTPEALEYWLRLIVEGYKRLYENEGFTESEVVKKFNEDYHRENNTVLEYLENKTVNDFLAKRSPEAYYEYEAWTNDNGMNTQSRKLFVNSVKQKFNLDLQPRNGQRVFVLM